MDYIVVYNHIMAKHSHYWRLNLTITESWPTLQRAAQTLYGFLSTFRSAKAFLILQPLLVQFTVVDEHTFLAERGRMTFATALILFHGNIHTLEALAAAVPPSMFSPTPAAPRAADDTSFPGGNS